MNAASFDAVFDGFHRSAFRLETLSRYSNPEEDAELELFRAGKLLPELSPQVIPWPKRLAETAAAGRSWRRVHVVNTDLTDYLRFEFERTTDAATLEPCRERDLALSRSVPLDQYTTSEQGADSMASTRRAQGTGSIVKRGQRYSVVIDLGRGPDGKRNRDWHSGLRTKKAAEKKLADLLGELERGEYVSPDKATLRAYLAERYFPHKARQVEPETLVRYRELLDAYVIPEIGDVPVQKLRPLHLVDVFDTLAKRTRRDGKPLSPRTQLHTYRALSAALKQAKRWRVIATNPAEAIDPPSVPETSIPALSREQAEKLLTEATGIMRTVVMLALATGMRRGELVALRWANVDLDAGVIRVEQSERATPKVGRRRKPPKSAAGRRLIELHPYAVAELRRHHTAQLETRLFVGPAYDADADLVLAKDDGSAYHPDWLTHRFGMLARKVGLPAGISLHGLRHAHASFLAAEGTAASDIAAVLGHADRGGLAQRVYIRPLGDAPSRAAARLGRAMGWEPK